MESLPVITVIGSLNTDLVTYTSRIPKGGETLQASSFTTGSGGKGANQAVACAKLSRSQHALEKGSAEVRMVGAVGSDAFGQTMLADLQRFGVKTSEVQAKEGERTGVAVIIVEEVTGENRIMLSAGANHTLLPEHFAELPLPVADLLIMQLEIPLRTVIQILEVAFKKSVAVLLNPAPAVPLPDEAYAKITHLVVNETEASILSGVKEEELEDVSSLEVVAKKFQELGAKNVLITLGGRGVFYAGAGGETGLVPAQKAKVVDTTAAGDTFVGSYALEVVKPGFNLKSAVEKANKAAALTVQRKGAQESIPWADELS